MTVGQERLQRRMARGAAFLGSEVAIIALALVISRSGWFELRPASGTAAAMAEAADRPVEPAR